MSYSVANVLIEAGVPAIRRWLADPLGDCELRDRLRNKMIRPTSIPQTLHDLRLEQAVCREALRLSLEHHRSLAVGLSGMQRRRGIADIFNQESSRYELVDMMALDVVIGSGGVLSHAPDRMSAALMMLDGFELRGVTQVTVDSIFMLPHLGVLSSIDPEAADEIFHHDCIVNVAYTVVPVYARRGKAPSELARVMFRGSPVGEVKLGDVTVLQELAGQRGDLRIEPAHSAIDVGAGPGLAWEREVEIGQCGVILDGRNRPLSIGEDLVEQARRQESIERNLGLSKGLGR